MRRPKPIIVLVTALGIALVVALFALFIPRKHEWPPQDVADFMKGCVSDKATAEQCGCMLTGFQKEYSLAEMTAQWMRYQNNQADPEFLEIWGRLHADCGLRY